MSKKSYPNILLWTVIFSVIALALKWYFISQRGYEMDIATFIGWSDKIKAGGFWSLYSSGYQSGVDYPPLIPLIGHYWLNLRGSLPLSDFQVFKLMPTLAEIIFSILAASVVIRSKSQYKIPLLALVIIQPALGVVTSAWGQVDAILSLFVICAFLVFEKNLYLASFFLFLALLTKPQALLAILVFFLAVLFRKGFINLFKQAFFWLVMLAVMILLFKTQNSNFLSVYLLSTGRYPHPSMNAFNFWWVFFGEQSHTISDSLGNIVSYKSLGYTLFAAFLVPAVYFLYKKAKTIADYFLVVSYSYILFFVFPTQIHERYIFPALALLPFAAVKSKKLFWVYVVLTITLLINNYAILQYAFPQFDALAFLKPASWVGDWTRALAVANVGIAVYLAFYFLYETYKKD